MKRRIRKKMLQKEIYLINESLVRNSYLVDKYKNESAHQSLINHIYQPI